MPFLAIQLKSKWHSVSVGSNGYFMACISPLQSSNLCLLLSIRSRNFVHMLYPAIPMRSPHYMDLISRAECALVKSKLGN